MSKKAKPPPRKPPRPTVAVKAAAVPTAKAAPMSSSNKYKTGAVRSKQKPRLTFAQVLPGKLPPVPKVFGHYNLFPPPTRDRPYPLGILANDRIGNCTICGPQHGIMLWRRAAGDFVHFTEDDAVIDYHSCCGYVPGDPSSDQGGEPVNVANYWQKTGLIDWRGKRHHIVSFMSIAPTAIDHIHAAAYLFGFVGLAIALPDNAETQFDAGQPWSDIAKNDNDLHYVPYWGRDADGYLHVATWGRDHQMTLGFLKANVREVVSYVSQDALNAVQQASPEGFDLRALLADQALAA